MSGARRWSRVVQPGYSYLCSNDPRVHFGLGSADKIDLLEIRWPDGKLETHRDLSVDRIVKIEEK